MSNINTPAEQALALLHETPNGGLSVLSGKGHAFGDIECVHWGCPETRCDCYVFEGDEEDLILAIGYEGEEYAQLDKLPDDAE
jgi:hypothetical protein